MSDDSYDINFRKRLNDAEDEATRFLAKLATFRTAYTKNEGTAPKESGAMKRASLDLTRALSELRKPYYS